MISLGFLRSRRAIFSLDHDVGNDAHTTLLEYALGQGQEYFGNVWYSPDGSYFGGRPDLGDQSLLSLWEVKPTSADWIVLGMGQVEYYSIVSGWGTARNTFRRILHPVSSKAIAWFWLVSGVITNIHLSETV
jgi:hypothetical protein